MLIVKVPLEFQGMRLYFKVITSQISFTLQSRFKIMKNKLKLLGYVSIKNKLLYINNLYLIIVLF